MSVEACRQCALADVTQACRQQRQLLMTAQPRGCLPCRAQHARTRAAAATQRGRACAVPLHDLRVEGRAPRRTAARRTAASGRPCACEAQQRRAGDTVQAAQEPARPPCPHGVRGAGRACSTVACGSSARSSSCMSAPVAGSTLAVHSSRQTMRGRRRIARARHTSCCWPAGRPGRLGGSGHRAAAPAS